MRSTAPLRTSSTAGSFGIFDAPPPSATRSGIRRLFGVGRTDLHARDDLSAVEQRLTPGWLRN